MTSDRDDKDRARRLEAENARLQNDVSQLSAELSRIQREQVEYLQNVSHQLVAPLNAIKWHIENLTSNRIGIERARKVMRSIYSQSTIAVHLAKNFALMSNLEEDHALSALKEPLQEISLYVLAVNIADDFQPQGWDREINISVAGHGFEDGPAVLVMKPLMSQVFSNIVENAVKYSRSNTTIRISGSFDIPNDQARIVFSNQGMALSSADSTTVFERGFRSTEARSKYPAGTGSACTSRGESLNFTKAALRHALSQAAPNSRSTFRL